MAVHFAVYVVPFVCMDLSSDHRIADAVATLVIKEMYYYFIWIRIQRITIALIRNISLKSRTTSTNDRNIIQVKNQSTYYIKLHHHEVIL